jgi:hypothetical protein
MANRQYFPNQFMALLSGETAERRYGAVVSQLPPPASVTNVFAAAAAAAAAVLIPFRFFLA